MRLGWRKGELLKNFYVKSKSLRKSLATSGLCPLYATMFSDAYPRCMMILKHPDRLPPSFHRTWAQHQRALKKNKKTPTDIDGVDRFRFFHRPLVPFLQPAVTTMTFRTVATEKRSEQILEAAPRIQNRGTQTDYRESESQTTPWAPPVYTRCSSTPEVLMLANLSWGHGLPAGMQEVEIIERARIKRAWESAVPGSGNPKSIERMRNIIDTLERDEWLFREKEIQTIHNMRLDMARQLLQKSQHEEIQRLNTRLQHCWTAKQQEKDRKIEKIRLDHSRELRKLSLRHKDSSMKYREGSVLKEHTGHRSELYGPRMHFGEHTKRRHEVINVCSRFLTGIKGLESLETVPKLLQPSRNLTKPLVKDMHELCIRETRWTEAALKQLHRDLKDTHMKTSREPVSIGLITRLQEPIPVPETPCTEGMPDPEAEMYRGQLDCQQLIEQMKTTTALQQEDLLHIGREQESIQSVQQEQLQNWREVCNFLTFVRRLLGT
ncbi:hypothetical protein Cfor_04360 [Coptotermes formosanus]|uniref:Cilia- and flagella-associated protein 91 n=1 Tax=Coptotermes formosanus TaxID=36987 RepID=A0A6L2PLL6_COPFO|nr:hypothetical protein Cfor_04360 [Coptotermes formosanus]